MYMYLKHLIIPYCSVSHHDAVVELIQRTLSFRSSAPIAKFYKRTGLFVKDQFIC